MITRFKSSHEAMTIHRAPSKILYIPMTGVFIVAGTGMSLDRSLFKAHPVFHLFIAPTFKFFEQFVDVGTGTAQLTSFSPSYTFSL